MTANRKSFGLRRLVAIVSLLCVGFASLRLYRKSELETPIERWANSPGQNEGVSSSSALSLFATYSNTSTSKWIVLFSDARERAAYIGRVELQQEELDGLTIWTQKPGSPTRDGSYFVVPPGKWYPSIDAAVLATIDHSQHPRASQFSLRYGHSDEQSIRWSTSHQTNEFGATQ